MKRVFVGNLNFGTTESDLRSLFEQFGEVGTVDIPKDRDSGRARGFAFVEMINEEEANKAIAALNGQEVNGRALNVNEARPKTMGGEGRRGDRGGFSRQHRGPRW
jgi:RNA recognition motif-containing protein